MEGLMGFGVNMLHRFLCCTPPSLRDSGKLAEFRSDDESAKAQGNPYLSVMSSAMYYQY